MTKPQVPTVQDAVTEPVPPRAGIIAESGENYLETILIIKERNKTLMKICNLAPGELYVNKASQTSLTNTVNGKT